jgi:hypothetical protein
MRFCKYYILAEGHYTAGYKRDIRFSSRLVRFKKSVIEEFIKGHEKDVDRTVEEIISKIAY